MKYTYASYNETYYRRLYKCGTTWRYAYWPKRDQNMEEGIMDIDLSAKKVKRIELSQFEKENPGSDVYFDMAARKIEAMLKAKKEIPENDTVQWID